MTNEEYRALRLQARETAHQLLVVPHFKSVGRYMREYSKKEERPLTEEEIQAIRLWLELPPWGVIDKGAYVVTDSYTD